jgi:hypothetical protein
VWIEKIDWRLKAPPGSHRSKDEGPLAELVQGLAELRANPTAWNEMVSQCDELKQLHAKLPKDRQEIVDALSLDDPSNAEELLARVEAILRTCLLSREDEK